MEYRRNHDGSVTELPPAVLACGHRYGPRRVTIGYGTRSGDDKQGRRVRTYTCRECGVTTFSDTDDGAPQGQYGPTADYGDG